jgi:hypothetical protein
VILEVGAGKLAPVYDEPLRTYGARLMGLRGDDLFLNVEGDGVLITDVSDAQKPRGRRFVRTLGWGSSLELANTHAYIPAGNFGVFEIDLAGPDDFGIN